NQVAKGHALIYRTRRLQVRPALALIANHVPRRLVWDQTVWLSIALFYGLFLGVAIWCANGTDRASQIIGRKQVSQMEEMYSQPLNRDSQSEPGEWLDSGRNDTLMTGFYIRNNAGIGLQCFGWGICFGIGSLYIMCSNAIVLGAVFGHMYQTPYWNNFSSFVTAHSAYELTAICLAASAGLRMGFGLVLTDGFSRLESLKRSAADALPMIGTATILFILAAFIEGYISASQIDYSGKRIVFIITLLSLLLFAARGLKLRGTP
ncbi:MAG: hypothetical protein RJA81_434, partial [Planctomycetota bacterium]